VNIDNVFKEAYNRKLKQTKNKKKSKLFAEACRISVKKKIKNKDNTKELKGLNSLIGVDLWQIK
jgi:hypothetical protein